MNYQQIPTKVNAVQYGYAEYSDNPLVLKDGLINNGTDWIEALLKDEVITPVFKSEDYWYLKVSISDGKELFASPGDWIVQDESGNLSVLSEEDFGKQYEAIK